MPRHQPITIADRSLLNSFGHPQNFRSNSVRIRRVLVAVIFGALSACSGEKTTAPVTVSSVSLTNASGTLQYGQTVQLTASVLSANGSALTGRPLTWSSSNDAIASVSSTGLVTAGAVRAGSAETATITVTSEGKAASAAVTVAPIPAATVTLSLAQVAVYVGQTMQLGVTVKDVTGGSLAARSVTWSSASSSVATVSQQGLVTALTAGTVVVTVTSEGKTASALITVRLVPVQTVSLAQPTNSFYVGQTLQVTAITRDSANNTLQGRSITWSSQNTSVVTISQTGVITGISVGTTTITATSEGKNGLIGISVLARVPGSITLSIVGLPSESLVSFTIQDENGLTQTRQTTAGAPLKVTDLVPGPIQIRAAEAGASFNQIPFRYNAQDNPRVIQLPNGASLATSFTYVLTSGAVQLQVVGVPSGFTSQCELRFSGGWSSFYAGPNQDVATATVGSAQLQCREIYDSNAKIWYDPNPASQAIIIQASTVPIVRSVQYAKRQ